MVLFAAMVTMEEICCGTFSADYCYDKNFQGNVIAILEHNGNSMVEFTYDAWGNILTNSGSMADSLGEFNPLRYRRYVYGQETGLYYL